MTRGRRHAFASLLAGIGLLGGLLAAPAIAEEAPSPAYGPADSAGSTDQIIVVAASRLTTDATIETATEHAAAAVGLDVNADVVRDMSPTASVVRLDDQLPLPAVSELSQTMSSASSIAYATPDIRVFPAAALPNDTYATSLWGLWDGGTASDYGTRALDAWTTTRGAGVTVAVLDTGITSHPDLNANVVSGYDFISYSWVANDGNGRDADASDPGDWCTADGSNSSWHGTHVAGTIAAIADDSYGVAGIAPLAKIQPVRVLGQCGGYSSDILDAITWSSGGSVSGVPANPTPSKVLNLSLGGGGTCDAYSQSVIDAARARGASIVVAAGNENSDAAGSWPANCNNVITVAASTRTGQRASYSNYGSSVEIAAPGGDWSAGVSGILSTLNTGSTTPGSPTWQQYRGTSMATPHVAGVAALLYSARPSITPAQVLSTIQATARPFASGSTCAGLCGVGYVDGAAAVASLGAMEPVGLTVTSDYEALDISWSPPPSGPAPLHYDFQYAVNGGAWAGDDTVAGTSKRLTGLTLANSYTVRVRSVTADDSSDWVTSTPTSPLARTVPGPITNLTIVTGDSTLQASWTAPASTGGYPISHYAVEYSTDDSTWLADDTVVTPSATIDGLVNGTAYKVRISAVNVAGPATPVASAYAVPRVLTAPSAPTNFTLTPEDAGIALEWSAPADDGGRPIDGYLVEYSSDGTNWSAIPGTYLGYAITILGLDNGTLYTVRVAATNIIGTGPWATNTATPTAPAPPSSPPPPPPPPPAAPAPPPPPPAPVITAPAAPTITEIGSSDGTAFALWLASDDTGGESPSSFTVELEGPDGTQTSTSDVEFAEFNGLVNGATYRLRVAATNSAGTGDFSPWSEPIIPIGPATAPTGLSGSAFDGGVELAWTAPSDSGGADIEDYVVQWMSDGVEVSLTTEATSIRLETLANRTRYDFRVAAQTEAGVGEWSAPLTLTPRADPVTAPQRVSLERAGRKVLVTWTAPAVGDPIRYVVAASSNGKPYRIQKSTTSTRVTLSLPKRTQTFAVRVLAIDSYGRGPWSDSATERVRR